MIFFKFLLAPLVGSRRSRSRKTPVLHLDPGRHSSARQRVRRLVAASKLCLLFLGLPLLAQESAPQYAKTLVAVRAEADIEIDGRLEEAVWKEANPATGFLQTEPYEGRAATAETEVRVIYDASNLYIGVYCYTEDPRRIIVNDLRRDFNPNNGDSIEIILDTLADKRSGFLFITNPEGAKYDAQLANDGRDINSDWDGVWHVESSIHSDGWSAELAIPFETLRFSEEGGGSWGINFLRRIRHKNEIDTWSLIPRRYLGGPRRAYLVSFSGELVGLEDMKQGRNLKVKPFAVASLRDLSSEDSVDKDMDAGLDIKYGLTSELTLDFTLNTDFSQVEADQQQINLTRFRLFFPEKRDFFLENSGVFRFGDLPNERGNNRSQETHLFFSRRIGLAEEGTPEEGETIPILFGARLSGRAGAYALGFLNVQTRESGSTPEENFTVLRVKRNLFSSSDVGFIFTNRESLGTPLHNRAVGLDANFRFFQNLTINPFWAKTQTPDRPDRDTAWKISSQWEDNFLTVRYLYADLEEDFNPEVGFVRRTGLRSNRLRLEFHPRPKENSILREVVPHLRWLYETDQENRLLTRSGHYAVSIHFQDGSSVEIAHNEEFERLLKDFDIHPPISIPTGDYPYDNWQLRYSSDSSKPISGTVRYTNGTFFDGEQRSLSTEATFRPNYKFSIALNYTYSDVDLRAGSFSTDLAILRTSYSLNTRMFLNALIQYNSENGEVSSNVRFNFIHRPLSDLFLVYNEQRGVTGGREQNRGIFFKYTHMLEF